jgi:hypothetical protein
LSAFSSAKSIPIAVSDLAPVANDVVQHFQQKGYETTSLRTITGGWDVNITKGGMFKAVVGTKSALKIEITPGNNQTNVTAGVGIFGQHAVPIAVAVILDSVFWPLMAAQIFGLVRQAHLDDEAIACVEDSLKIHATQNTVPANSTPKQRFCVECGTANAPDALICTQCGVKLPG